MLIGLSALSMHMLKDAQLKEEKDVTYITMNEQEVGCISAECKRDI